MGWCKRLAAALMLSLAVSTGAAGGLMAEPNIQQLTTPKGLTVWLVESHQIPMVSFEVAFRAGSAFEGADKQGVANLTASMMDEGAGDLDALAFREAMDDIGARFGATADKMDTTVHMTTLSDHKARAFELMKMALQAPKFNPVDVARVKAATVAGIRQREENPGAVSQMAHMKMVFGEHPYGWQTSGTEESVTALKPEDLQHWYKTQYTRSNMVVSVVGDITPPEVVTLVDEMLAGLPEGSGRNRIATGPKEPGKAIQVIKKKVPQASVYVGHLGMSREDPDYYAQLVMNDLLGGNPLMSRLGDVVREKHGLVYDVRSVNLPLPHMGAFYVQLQTENGKAQKALDLVKAEIERVRSQPVGEEEFKDTIDYLVGSFPLRIDSNAKILDYLTLMQMEDLGADYLTTWSEKIKAVTPADVQRVAQKMLHPDRMVVTVVGDGPALKVNF